MPIQVLKPAGWSRSVVMKAELLGVAGSQISHLAGRSFGSRVSVFAPPTMPICGHQQVAAWGRTAGGGGGVIAGSQKPREGSTQVVARSAEAVVCPPAPWAWPACRQLTGRRRCAALVQPPCTPHATHGRCRLPGRAAGGRPLRTWQFKRMGTGVRAAEKRVLHVS